MIASYCSRGKKSLKVPGMELKGSSMPDWKNRHKKQLKSQTLQIGIVPSQRAVRLVPCEWSNTNSRKNSLKVPRHGFQKVLPCRGGKLTEKSVREIGRQMATIGDSVLGLRTARATIGRLLADNWPTIGRQYRVY